MPECGTCAGSGWVCECHPRRPWGGMCCELPDSLRTQALMACPWLFPMWLLRSRLFHLRRLCEHGACHCGGAGMACQSCNPEGRVDWLHVEAEAA